MKYGQALPPSVYLMSHMTRSLILAYCYNWRWERPGKEAS